MSVKNVKYVDEMTKYIVLGFFHELQKALDLIVPDDVINICILYFFVSEYFAKCGPFLSLKTDSVLICCSAVWNTAYGSIIIDGEKAFNSIYKWTFEINNHCEGGTLIGIDSSEFLKINSDITAKKCVSECYYAFFPKRGRRFSHQIMADEYGNVCYGNCVNVVMELNCKKKKLKYFVDGKFQGVAFRNIDFTTKYRLAISVSAGQRYYEKRMLPQETKTKEVIHEEMFDGKPAKVGCNCKDNGDDHGGGWIQCTQKDCVVWHCFDNITDNYMLIDDEIDDLQDSNDLFKCILHGFNRMKIGNKSLFDNNSDDDNNKYKVTKQKRKQQTITPTN